MQRCNGLRRVVGLQPLQIRRSSLQRVLGLVQRIDDERKSVSRELRAGTSAATGLPPVMVANPA